MVFKFRPGYHSNGGDAQKTGEILAKMEENGQLTAANVVKKARPEKSPLHCYFTWDDKVAAEKFREQEARVLIASIVVTQEDGQIERRFYNIEVKDPEYKSIDTIMLSKDDSNKLLKLAFRDMKIFRNKYQRLSKELGGVLKAIDETIPESEK